MNAAGLYFCCLQIVSSQCIEIERYNEVTLQLPDLIIVQLSDWVIRKLTELIQSHKLIVDTFRQKSLSSEEEKAMRRFRVKVTNSAVPARGLLKSYEIWAQAGEQGLRNWKDIRQYVHHKRSDTLRRVNSVKELQVSVHLSFVNL